LARIISSGLPALQWITPQVIAVQLDQVEGVQEYAFVVMPVANEIERSDAVVITGNRFDDAGERAQARQGLAIRGKRYVRCQGGFRASPVRPSCGQSPEPVVLDLVQPFDTEGRFIGLVGRDGAMNPAGRVRCNMPARSQVHAIASSSIKGRILFADD
jgi:hypothetical protein